MLFQATLFFLGLLGAVAETNHGRQINFTGIFGSALSPGASIYFPGGPGYDTEITQRYSTFAEPSYIVAIKPATEQDVQTIVKLANRFNIPFLATGGGHGSEPGYANIKYAIDIDLGNFNTTRVDAKNNLLTAGGATRFGQIYQPLYDAGKELQTGNAPCVNLVGATIGAGVGPLEGEYGLIIDALVSVRMVTSRGSLITVSKMENSDLFWAIRGAGANFGIITYATYGIHDAKNNGIVFNADFNFDPAANTSVYELLQTWDDDYPAQMGLSIAGSYTPATNIFFFSVNIQFHGTAEEAKPYFDKFMALNPLQFQNLSVPFPQIPSVSEFGHGSAACVKGSYNSHYSVGANRTDPAVFTDYFNKMKAFGDANPWYSGSFVVQRYSPVVALSVPKKDRGVYPWRDIKSLIVMENVYPNATYDDTVNKFSRAARDIFYQASGFDTKHVYLNYGYGDEGPEVWFGKENLPRLVALKQRWDPENRFGAGNPVPRSL